MKARVAKRQSFNESGITLSVGMIVKNEEKHLEKCLTALSPLLNAVPSELIIVDTGSADKTVEIAGRFTDKVFHFEWINDFGAARNFGLEKCVGEWFMFLDADEIFDADLSDMIAFFRNSETRRRYNSLTYMIRNYHDQEGSAWSSSILARAVKRLPGVRFLGSIHEYLDPFPSPIMGLKTFVHHRGYVFDSEEDMLAKRERNLIPLYEELKKAPRDIRIRSHILVDVKGEEFAEMLAETLVIAKKQPNNLFAQGLFALNIINYYTFNNFESVLGSVDEFLKTFGKKPKTTRWLDVYAARGLSLMRLERHEEAIKAFDEYFRLYDLFLENKLAADMSNLAITFCESAKHKELKNDYESLLLKTGRRTFSFVNNAVIEVKTSATAVQPKESDELDEADWKPVLEAIKNSADVTGIAANTDREQLGRYMTKISQQVFNLPNLALDFNPGTRNALFDTVLYETASKQAGRLPWHERAAFYKNFVTFAANFAENYNPDDELHRFGRYAGEGKYKEALEVLQSEHLKWAVEFLIEDSEENSP
jgi:glycosyltransferase involved in cell wall biosynthesis